MHWPDFFSPGCPRAADHQAAPSMLSGDQTEPELFLDVGFSTSQLALILSPAS